MEKILLITHASAGFITLVTGIIAMIFPKRLNIHRPSGKVFYYAMWYVVVTAFILSVLKSNLFLFMIGTLVFYTNTMGLRCLKLYKSTKTVIGWKEWSIWIITFLLIASVQTYIITKIGFRIDGAFLVLNIFSVILISNLIQDLRLLLTKKNPRKDFLLAHVGKMGGTFIAAITAALVQNVQSEPIWIAWLLPTAIFTPVIVYYSRNIRSGKFWSKKRKPVEKL
ncbi:hypothetical protein GCM10011506_42840 [Marivirga lumbricoides]|uniref:DUF2306 domain-containing protein n=1 Tax=Marivirga lumbricoides TaxID=1046115 RepID=A0ABQ1N431_9BACT|nr:hypothetical protein GCM10011506_42840 [Marivirga lumbricoides]